VDEKKRIERKVTPRYSIVNRVATLFFYGVRVYLAPVSSYTSYTYKTRAKTTTE
jgi:hypothetical protein